VLFEQLFVDNL